MNALRRTERGFTLLEIMVAMVILAGISLAAWLSFDGMVRMKETVEVTEQVANNGRVALQRIHRELTSAFLTRHPSPNGNYQTVFWGDDQNEADTLTFASFSHIRLYRDSTEGDAAEISWFLAPDPDLAGLSLLLHREGRRVDGKPEEDGPVEVLARNVKAFNIRYWDETQEEWKDTWDSTSTESLLRLPRAVEVQLTLADAEGGEHLYATTVLLPSYATRGGPGGPVPQRLGR